MPTITTSFVYNRQTDVFFRLASSDSEVKLGILCSFGLGPYTGPII
ncbi:unnamed protein product [Brassica rapa subsp. trilocularis]|uniref:(rape) hypothetical protein n=1 Tax=Brassica napus TaxID=3708 RepID=A0A816ZMT8_BRANA|nr:unnamed protein product [Brassica napus]